MPAVSISRTGRTRPSALVQFQSTAIEIAGDAGLRPGDEAVLPEKPVDERGFAGIGATDDGEFQDGGFGVEFAFLLGFGFVLALDIGAQRVEQVGDALAMFGGELHRIAKAQRQRFEHAILARAPFRLVGDQHDRAARRAQPAGDLLVQRGDAGARVDHEQRDIGHLDRRLRLHPHPARQRRRILILEPRRVDDGEVEAEQRRLPSRRSRVTPG